MSRTILSLITVFISSMLMAQVPPETDSLKNNNLSNIKPDLRTGFETEANSAADKSIQRFTNIDDHYIYEYSKPKFFDMVRYIPHNIYDFGVFTIQKENLKWDALVLGSTAAILPFDQKILDGAGELGSRMGGWDKDSKYGTVAGIFTIVPKNISSAVYYTGNGGTTLILSAIFLSIGKLKNNDLRALNTSSELVEGLLSVGVATQTLKRITGRQSPSAAIADNNSGGDWNPFPSFTAFQSNTPNYDAMPSGHIATFMSTLTIISTNYPEIKWIKPVGYSLMGVLAFNMVSGKVHWTSDYPIGIFMGYVIGKQIANRRITKIAKDNVTAMVKKPYKIDYQINRINHTTLVGATVTF
ncbi:MULTISPECIES: phosphatase PAP2 family protein [unclassified Flavobacterium]|uniref:phosphatase PAP2 family protein n=1 Tax=unclassified Flavobacterium TaxID=196869 RepID=UPI000A4A7E27|nr:MULTISPECIES: phosphatase PAP2 family protein [unclassified Flavobacterium]MBN9284852.1 phosphatase PAP2 family protein [Flavobacterium sp.]